MKTLFKNNPWTLPVQEVLRNAGSDLDGLSEGEVRRRLMQYGSNTLAARDQESWHKLLFHQFANPLVYMLIGAALVKAYFKGLIDAAVIGAVLLFMAIIGFAQEMKARKAMHALLSLSAPRAKVRREGKVIMLNADQLVPGDILILEAGDRVAADARLVETANLKINESTFTGESLPVDKDTREVLPDALLHDRKNMVFLSLIHI